MTAAVEAEIRTNGCNQHNQKLGEACYKRGFDDAWADILAMKKAIVEAQASKKVAEPAATPAGPAPSAGGP